MLRAAPSIVPAPLAALGPARGYDVPSPHVSLAPGPPCRQVAAGPADVTLVLPIPGRWTVPPTARCRDTASGAAAAAEVRRDTRDPMVSQLYSKVVGTTRRRPDGDPELACWREVGWIFRNGE